MSETRTPPKAPLPPLPDGRIPDIVRGFTKDVEDPAILHAELRRTCPVALQNGGGGTNNGLQDGWLVTRYEDILAVSRDTDTFGQSIRWPSRRRPPLESNPPEHRQFRALMQPFFMPAALAPLEPLSRGIALSLLEPLLAAGGGDFAHAVARPLPPQILLARMNQPPADWARIKECCEAAYLQGSKDPADIAAFNASNDYLWEYSRAAVADRVANPRDSKADIIQAMLDGQIDGAPVDRGLIEGMVRLVIAAGHDSTTSALGICVGYLAEHPDAQQALREKPAMIGTAIEEILRLRAPVIQMPRVVRKAAELGGRKLKEGDRLLMVFASGNHDEEAFEDVETCMLDRMPNRHLSFGVGVHVCIGNGLARQEMRVTLEELLARTAAFGLERQPHREFWHPYGATELPLWFK